MHCITQNDLLTHVNKHETTTEKKNLDFKNLLKNVDFKYVINNQINQIKYDFVLQTTTKTNKEQQ